MLGWIAELLPLFFVRWVALRTCERMPLAGAIEVVTARPDVLILAPDKMRGAATARRR